jgi:hypothetical protein
MQEVWRYIEQRAAEQQRSPFIAWLSDETVPARDRLMGWLPCAAPWVVGFMDLNGELLKYPEDEASREPYKRAINDHVHEDSQHWSLYIEDLRRLELDAPLPLPDLLQFLWGSETRSQRFGVYKLSALADQAQDPLLRYCLIAALEALAHMLFAALQRVSAPYGRQTGVELLYVGPVHAAKEPGRLANQSDAIEARMRAEVLDEPTRRVAIDIARQVCDVVAARWDELHRCGRSNRYLAFYRSA